MRTLLVAIALVGSLTLGLPVAMAADWQGPEDVLAAAKRGDAEAQLEMGILFEYGYQLKDNEVPALAWYMLAADQGIAKAASHRDALISRLTDTQVNEARAMSKTLQVNGSLPKGQPKPMPAEPGAPMEPAPVPTEPAQ